MSSASDEEGNLRLGEERDEKRAVWGGAAVIFGLVLEVAYAIAYPKGQSILEEWGPVFADTFVALGVAAEVLFAARARSKAAAIKVLSDKRIAEANDRAAQATKEAAEAQERTAQIEKLTAWRRVSPEQHRQIADAICGEMTPLLDILIESQYGDPEAYSYAFDIHKVFIAAGVTKVRGGQNMFLDWMKFGLLSAASDTINFSLISEAFKTAAMPLIFNGPDPSRDLPRGGGLPVPDLYIFVAPKLPVHFETFAREGDAIISDAANNAREARESSI